MSGVGDRELGRGEDRLAGRVGDVGRGLREPRVLAFVVRDDAFEAVVGIEAARRASGAPGSTGCRGRGTRSRRSSGWPRDELEHLGDRVARLAAREVDRVVAAPARRELLVDRGAQVVGQRRRARGRRRATIASAVTTPQPPAVVTHRGARPGGQRLRRERRRRFERLLDRRRARDAGLAAHAVEDPVVGRERSRCGSPRRAGRPRSCRPSRARPACARATAREPLEERAPVGDALDVREAHRGRVVVGVPVEVVGDRRPRPRCPRSPRGSRRRRSATAQFSNDETKLPDWLAIAIRPARRVRRDDLRAQPRRRRHDALAVRAREQDAELVGERDELGFGARGPSSPASP